MVHIRVISDLHLEFADVQKKATRLLSRIPREHDDEVLVIAGDFSCAFKSNGQVRRSIAMYLKVLSDRWGPQRVVLVSGNHEYYRTRDLRRRNRCANSCSDRVLHELTDDVLRDAAESAKAVFLQRYHHVIRELDVTIVGCTLWSRVNPNAWNMMNDKHCAFPRDGLPGAIQAHKGDLEYLETFLDAWKNMRPGERTTHLVVATHHLPALDMVAEHHATHPANSGFVTDLSDMLTRHHDSIDLWCCGHTHTPAIKEVCGVLIVCSPVGYPGERPRDESLSETVKLARDSASQRKSVQRII